MGLLNIEIRNMDYRSTSSKMLRISSLSGYNNTISSCCALSKSLHPFAIRTIVLLAHAVQARKCYAFPRCRAIALSKSDLSISPASSRIDISRFWYCSMLVYIITRFLRAAHSRNRYIHSQSGLSSFLPMSVAPLIEILLCLQAVTQDFMGELIIPYLLPFLIQFCIIEILES